MWFGARAGAALRASNNVIQLEQNDSLGHFGEALEQMRRTGNDD
jgi:hypothetical protein